MHLPVIKRRTINIIVQHNKKHHRRVLLISFHMNGHTLGFNLQAHKLELPCTA